AGGIPEIPGDADTQRNTEERLSRSAGGRQLGVLDDGPHWTWLRQFLLFELGHRRFGRRSAIQRREQLDLDRRRQLHGASDRGAALVARRERTLPFPLTSRVSPLDSPADPFPRRVKTNRQVSRGVVPEGIAAQLAGDFPAKLGGLRTAGQIGR